MSDRRHLWYRQMSIQQREDYQRRKNARRRMEEAQKRGDFNVMRESAISTDLDSGIWKHIVVMFALEHGRDKIPPAFQPNWNPDPVRSGGPTKVMQPGNVPVLVARATERCRITWSWIACVVKKQIKESVDRML